ncbi:VOC family protein [Hyphomicrobium sp. LHD-15]|uniref:VOC family protein n=1 Tax=Hyphomicrobium sp. LHD-15 TaxID=3072142 RepID=UPI00280D7463|nr:VOC family protein [Hyphomicrobium sp. LHD-15]MDQ8698927.1 VOC family protein [Hyphomicrobium sp. LHD-15]
MTPTAVLETVLYARDLDAAEEFYGRVLGLTPYAKIEGRHVFYKLEHQMLLIFNPEATRKPMGGALPVPTHGAEGHGHVCFAADAIAIAGWRDRLSRLGIAIEADFEWPNGGRSIYFRDPAGNSVEFAEPRIWGFAQ